MDVGCALFVILENIVIRMVFMRSFITLFLGRDVIIAVSELKWLRPFSCISSFSLEVALRYLLLPLFYYCVKAYFIFLIFSTFLYFRMFCRVWVWSCSYWEIDYFTVICIFSYLCNLANFWYFYYSYQLLNTIVTERNVRNCCTSLDHRTRPPCLRSSEGWYAFYIYIYSIYLWVYPNMYSIPYVQEVITQFI